MRSFWRVAIAAYTVATGIVAYAVPASAQPAPLPPLPPAPGYPPGGLIVPGISGPPYGNVNYGQPIPPGTQNAPVDAGDVGVSTNADLSDVGLPASRLGEPLPRTGPFGPSPGVRVTTGAAGVIVDTLADNPPLPTGEMPLPASTPSQTSG